MSSGKYRITLFFIITRGELFRIPHNRIFLAFKVFKQSSLDLMGHSKQNMNLMEGTKI